MPFTINAKNIFLTYAQCPLDKDDVADYLTQLLLDTGHPLQYITVGAEQHADGNPHLHVLLSFDRAFYTRDERYFDIGPFDDNGFCYHPNVQAARRPKECLDYCTKDGDYTKTHPADFGSCLWLVSFLFSYLIFLSLIRWLQPLRGLRASHMGGHPGHFNRPRVLPRGSPSGMPEGVRPPVRTPPGVLPPPLRRTSSPLRTEPRPRVQRAAGHHQLAQHRVPGTRFSLFTPTPTRRVRLVYSVFVLVFVDNLSSLNPLFFGVTLNP